MDLTFPEPIVAASSVCAHCGLPAPRGDRFCCAGCETVFHALAAGGLTEYYALADREARAAHTTDRSYAELDDGAFARRHVRGRADGMCETSLYLEDLRCGACVWLVERTPRLLDGVREVRVDLGRGRADVVYDPRVAPLSSVARTIDRLGHPVHPYRGLDRDQQRRREDRALLVKIGVAGAAAGNIMLLAAALYAGAFGELAVFFRWASMLVAVPALTYAATPFWRGALAALRARRLHLDLPISIGIAAGLAWGVHDVIAGTGELYFDSLGMLVFLLLSARWLQARQTRRAASAAEILHALTPARARRVDPGGAVSDVPIEAVAIGDLIEARAGDTIAVDGVIDEGTSAVDAGLLTGEPRPVDVGPGDPVAAGAVNLAAPIRIRTTAAGEDTRVGRLAARLGELTATRPRITQLVDRVSAKFVAVVLFASLATVALWWQAGPEGAVAHAMALLVVTCPCALALATPLTFGIAIGRAAKQQVLIKSHDALERLAEKSTIVLDKTGTVTLGAMRVEGWTGDERARELAAVVERASAHPLARAIAAAVPGAHGLAVDVREDTGRGIAGRVHGHEVAVGSPRWIAARAQVPAPIAQAIAAAAGQGATPVVVAIDGTARAVARLVDPIRADANASIARLRALGHHVELLSGDDPRVVAQVGASLGLAPDRCRGGATPEDKLAHVQALAARGPTIMVGDGENDAAAVAAATAGIAVHGGAEASIDAADVFLRAPGLAPVVAVVDGARASLATVRRCLRFSLTYNLTMGTLAIAGLVHPLLAAALMPASSLTVLACAVRSKAFR